MLAEIPFVRLIDGSVPQFLRQQRAGFSDSVRIAQALEDEPLLKINVNGAKNYRLSVSSLELQIPITDVNFAFYLWLLNRSQNGQSVERRKVITANRDYANEFLTVYRDSLKACLDFHINQSKGDEMKTKPKNCFSFIAYSKRSELI